MKIEFFKKLFVQLVAAKPKPLSKSPQFQPLSHRERGVFKAKA
jgi:hypothetical protein